MTPLSESERATQNRVARLFCDELGYRHLGNWQGRAGNSPIEESLLTPFLAASGYSAAHISRALHLLRVQAQHPERTLYATNQAVYGLLRYGVPVKLEAGALTETVQLIDWQNPQNNHFAMAEEVTLKSGLARRPDIVLYVNGIAIGVLELKNSRISVGEGIRQSLSNQQPEFNAWFFSTVQLVLAGNDSEGLRYGAIGTPDKLFLSWKEDEAENERNKLDKYLLKLCSKPRLIELMRDFVLFDGGVKKLPRVHQYFGLKAAQAHVMQKKGGILWHTQGSGKSLVMVLLARWILEHRPHARVVIITDRDELDKQIARVFTEAGETICRTRSGRELMARLAEPQPRLLCSLVHKFGLEARGKNDAEFARFIDELQTQPGAAVGELFVFVDECHRTQGGRLNRVMKAMLPNAVFIGFTGTSLLKADRQTSLDVFGGYIHTYKFSEAVQDKVVLDLAYEARDIDQALSATGQIDQWFDVKTQGLNDWQKNALKKQWGTLQKVLSSRSRMERVVADIIFDFAAKARLSSGRGNAMLVAASIYEACKYFTLFEATLFKGRCAVVTSYNPQAKDVTLEETGENTETDRQFIYNTYTELLKNVAAQPGKTRTESYEDAAKQAFIKEPGRMRLLIVVDKLLTGFDAPPCSYLYIDKAMQDHALFQAICRTNRLDGEDKDFGRIVDYKKLFGKVEGAMAVYTSELDCSAGGADPQVLLHDRLTLGRERLEAAIETLALLCEPVQPPRAQQDYIRYFCGNTEIATDLAMREPQREALYTGVVALVRAGASIAGELGAAGYSPADVARIEALQKHYLDLREVIRLAAGETLDLKPYEADMRHLIDTYIEASAPRKISPFDGMGLLALIVKSGMVAAIDEQLGCLKGESQAIAETIENNVRSKIIKDSLSDPAYFATMSALLDDIIRLRKTQAIAYEDYLSRMADVAAQVQAGRAKGTPAQLDTPGKLALFNNLQGRMTPAQRAEFGAPDDAVAAALGLALKLDAVVRAARQDGWRGVQAREMKIKQALYGVLKSQAEVERIFLIVFAQLDY